MLGNFLQQLRSREGWTLEYLSGLIEKNKPSELGSMDKAILSKYETGKYDLSPERMQTILMYGFKKSAKQAELMIAQYILEQQLLILPDDMVKESLHKIKDWS